MCITYTCPKLCDVVSGIGIGAAAADNIGRQHGIGLTLKYTITD